MCNSYISNFIRQITGFVVGRFQFIYLKTKQLNFLEIKWSRQPRYKNYCKVENEKFFKKGNIIMYYARFRFKLFKKERKN
jgi:hypothetical protein